MLQIVKPKEKPDFETFYSDNFQKVVNYLNNKIGNYHDSQDLASDIMLYCYSHYDEYDPAKSSITTWLYLIVNSRLKNFYRDHKVTEDIDPFIGVLPDGNDDMDNAIYIEQLHDLLVKAITVLPERQRQAVVLKYFRKQSNEQIAQFLDTTPGNVRVMLSRAMTTLEKKCGSLLEGEL